MNHTVDAALWTAAVLLGGAALWLSRPQPLPFDPARLFGFLVATRLRGEVEQAGGEVPAWEARLAAELPSGLHPGTLRWTDDPADLGPAFDPVARLGVDCTWDAVADWSAPVTAAVLRRLGEVPLVWLGAPAVEIAVPTTTTLPARDDAAMERLLDRPDRRIVVAAAGRDAQGLLAWLHDAPGLRDRVRAVLLVAPELDSDWLAAHWGHAAFETELVHEVPFLVLRADAAGARLPDPTPAPNHRASLTPVDLGAVAVPSASVHGRALAALLAALAG